MKPDDLYQYILSTSNKKMRTQYGHIINCLFHKDKKPSMSITLEQGGGYNCFSCGRHGNLWNLGKELGMEMDETKDIKHYRKKLKTKKQSPKKLHNEKIKIRNDALAYYNSYNGNTEPPYTANPKKQEHQILLQECVNRGIYDETMVRFKLEWNNPLDAISFPYLTEAKNLIGFCYQRFTGNTKYQLSSGLKKNFIFFNLPDLAKNYNKMVLVEGVWDCLAISQALYYHGILDVGVLGISGCHVSDTQISLLYKPKEIILFLDGDEAGKKGTLEAMKKIKNKYPNKIVKPINTINLIQEIEDDSLNDPCDIIANGHFWKTFENIL